MLLICPTCGNEISIRIGKEKEEGYCPLCKRDFKVIRVKKKNKVFITLVEK